MKWAVRKGLITLKRVTFYYVRHGRTEFNRDGIVQGGRVDSPLVEESLPLIEATAQALANVPFARCYCSPLGRARETARMVVGQRNIGIRLLDELREFDFGEIDGKPAAQVGSKFAACFVRQDFSRYGGEKGSEVRARVRTAFVHMFNLAQEGDNVLVVAHGSLFRYVLLEFYPGNLLKRKIMSEVVRTPNAGIAVVRGSLPNSEGLAKPPLAQRPKFVLVSLPVAGDKFVPPSAP